MNRRNFARSIVAFAGVLVMAACAFSTPALAQGGGPNRITFSGNVDDTVNVHFRGTQGWVTNKDGKGVTNLDFTFRSPLPADTEQVSIVHFEGRGNVYVLHQPTPDNNYTAVVRIEDPQTGRGYYKVVVGW